MKLRTHHDHTAVVTRAEFHCDFDIKIHIQTNSFFKGKLWFPNV